ncbi:hypothetical protein HG536_0F02060 [Torulaspora globosa]|uniref:Target of rapamycin complex 2 subunit BIT2 n=1 Tax=Torulaspora globosa TaxID=48254 RepID=A0A7G3ZK45_9SACH|nr:uncharacterized protein HG536_0F02060 [Torulaspora globosa]QLL33881.1 hypothetical protein HG536_0F02060 [Torulaspora globosa]
MTQPLNRKRSATAVLSTARQEDGQDSANRTRARFYSISSNIIPQTLTHPDDDEGLDSTKVTAVFPPSWSHVGFQSIFNGGGQRRSKRSLRSNASLEDHSLATGKSCDSLASSAHRRDFHRSEDDISNESINTSGSSTKGKMRSTFLGIGKDNQSLGDRNSRIFRTSTNRSSSSVSGSLLSTKMPNKTSSLSNIAKKLFKHRQRRVVAHDEELESVTPTPLSKILHSSYARHKAPSQFIHNSSGEPKSAYSFHSLNQGGQYDKQLLPIQDENSFTANLMFLHDFLKNLSTLEANYKNFHAQELHLLEENIWTVHCTITTELFKFKRIWQLPAKVEDLNRLLDFYITLKTESKASSPNGKFLDEVEEFLTSSLYILENQIVFNYANEDIMNTSLKRLGVIWHIFYEQVYYDVMAVFMPLERSFQASPKYWQDRSFQESPTQHILSVDYLLLRCFRDCIVLPYYQNFIDSNEGASKSFQMYIFNEEEENGVTQQDKLTLLQCFGVLNSIQSNDQNQKVIEDLLEGTRRSI